MPTWTMLCVSTVVMLVQLKYLLIFVICAQKTVGYAQYVSMLYGGQIKKTNKCELSKNPDSLSCLDFLYLASLIHSLNLIALIVLQNPNTHNF